MTEDTASTASTAIVANAAVARVSQEAIKNLSRSERFTKRYALAVGASILGLVIAFVLIFGIWSSGQMRAIQKEQNHITAQIQALQNERLHNSYTTIITPGPAVSVPSSVPAQVTTTVAPGRTAPQAVMTPVMTPVTTAAAAQGSIGQVPKTAATTSTTVQTPTTSVARSPVPTTVPTPVPPTTVPTTLLPGLTVTVGSTPFKCEVPLICR